MEVPGWVSGPFAQVLTLEREATHILQNQPILLPSPLQTAEYATALLSAIAIGAVVVQGRETLPAVRRC